MHALDLLWNKNGQCFVKSNSEQLNNFVLNCFINQEWKHAGFVPCCPFLHLRIKAFICQVECMLLIPWQIVKYSEIYFVGLLFKSSSWKASHILNTHTQLILRKMHLTIWLLSDVPTLNPLAAHCTHSGGWLSYLPSSILSCQHHSEGQQQGCVEEAREEDEIIKQ